MKVGIVTLLGNNYGGALQAYALKRTLEKLKIDVDTINYISYSETKKTSIKDFAKKFIYRNRHNKFKEFKKQYFNLTSPIKDIKEFKNKENEYDAFIAGSDQIWNQKIEMRDREVYYLSFVENAKKIAYAASIGRDTVEDNEVEKISYLLDRFNNISIREKKGVELYQPLTKNKIENVLDPTFLLTTEEWNEIAKRTPIEEDYVFSYTLGADKKVLDTIDELSQRLGLGIVEIYYKKNFKNDIININNAGPKEFVGLIKDAKYVLTNSFHGMVFSILNRKNFWVFTRGNMNSRIYSLLEILGLQDRIIDSDKIDEVNKIDISSEVDYNKVYQILEKEKEKSLNFLKQALDIKE